MGHGQNIIVLHRHNCIFLILNSKDTVKGTASAMCHMRSKGICLFVL